MKKSKKLILIVALFAAAFILIGGKIVSVCAAEPQEVKNKEAETEEQQNAKEELEKNIDELLDALDTEDLQNYLDSVSDFGKASVKDRLKSLITGDAALDYSSLWQSLLGLLWEDVALFLPAFALILSVSLLCGILNSSKSGFLHSTMSDIIGFVSFLSVGAIVLSCLISVLSVGFETIENMRRQMEIVYPLLLTLMAAGGGAVSAAVFRPAAAFMSGAVLELFSSVVLPVSLVVIVLAFVGNLSDSIRTDKLGDFFKSVSKWLIGLTLGLFSLFLSVQGMTSAQYDGLSLRAVKYVISGSVPIVGGFLSGGVDLVLAGSVLIKNALGSVAIFLLAAVIIRPLLLFSAFQLFLRLSAAVTEPVGGKIPVFLSRLAGDTGFFLAGLLCIAFLYFLTLLLLVCSSGVFI